MIIFEIVKSLFPIWLMFYMCNSVKKLDNSFNCAILRAS